MVKKEARKVVLKDAQGGYLVPVIDPADKGGGGGYTPNLLDTKWSDHILNDIRWLRGDTFSWQDGILYEGVYNLLLEEYNKPDTSVVVNADKVGSVYVIENGVANNFSSSSYLTKGVNLSSDRNISFPMIFDITTGNDVTTEQYIMAIDGWCMQLSVGTDSKLHLYLGSGSAWDIANGASGTTTIEANTSYRLILTYDGNEYVLQVITNGNNPTVINDIVLASNTMVCTGSRNLYLGTDGGHTIPFLGTIKVSECALGENWHGTFSRTSKGGFTILDSNQEQYAFQIFHETGVAWFYILDRVNKRFKLPRTKYDFVGLRDDVGRVTNIATAGTDTKATQMYLYFYVGDYVQDAVEQTAGLNAELFNNKVDLNASNLNAQGRSYVSGLGMPSNKSVEIDVGASNAEYIAPANGRYCFKIQTSDVGRIGIYRPGDDFLFGNFNTIPYITGGIVCTVLKGDKIIIDYSGTITNKKLIFGYAEGEDN